MPGDGTLGRTVVARKRKRVYALALLLPAFTAGIWFAYARYAPHAKDPAAEVWQASFPDLQGRPQPLAQWRGQVLVLNFWASWCAPCREEMPEFDALRTQLRGAGVEFVGIAIDNPANVARFLQRQPVSYPILIGEGPGHLLARQLGNASGGMPFTLVFDREGRVVLRYLGRLRHDTLDAALRQHGA